MGAFLALVLIVGAIWFVAIVSAKTLGAGPREERRVLKQARQDLRSERERSTLAQSALREIAAGDASPVFRASDALNEINKTYSKEIV